MSKMVHTCLVPFCHDLFQNRKRNQTEGLGFRGPVHHSWFCTRLKNPVDHVHVEMFDS